MRRRRPYPPTHGVALFCFNLAEARDHITLASRLLGPDAADCDIEEADEHIMRASSLLGQAARMRIVERHASRLP